MADQVVVMSEAANDRLCRRLRRRSPKGHHDPARRDHPDRRPARSARVRPTLLTWGLLGPGKGVERVIDAMASLRICPAARSIWSPARPTRRFWPPTARHTATPAIEQARHRGVADSVCFDAGYRSVASLNALAQSAAAVVLPYDSTDQVTSGVLVDAIASGRPVVATAFPHAVELLGSGAGIVVDHDDPGCAGVGPAPRADRAAPGRLDGRRGPSTGAEDGLVGGGRARICAWRNG